MNGAIQSAEHTLGVIAFGPCDKSPQELSFIVCLNYGGQCRGGILCRIIVCLWKWDSLVNWNEMNLELG